MLLFKTLQCCGLLYTQDLFLETIVPCTYSSPLLTLTLILLASFKSVTNRENIKCRNEWGMQPCLADVKLENIFNPPTQLSPTLTSELTYIK